jgi:hypothetical protein
MASRIAYPSSAPSPRLLGAATFRGALLAAFCLLALDALAPALSLAQDSQLVAVASERRERRNQNSRRQKEEPATAPVATSDAPVIAPEDQELVTAVERGLQQTDTDAVLRVFGFFGTPEEDTRRLEMMRLFLQGVFEQFGPLSYFGQPSQPKEELGLGVLQSGEDAQWRNVNCGSTVYHFSGALGKTKGVGVRLTACRASEKNWLKELAFVLGDPTSETRAKAERFQSALKTRYAALPEPAKPARPAQSQEPKASAAQPSASGQGMPMGQTPQLSLPGVQSQTSSMLPGPLGEMLRTVGAVTSTAAVLLLSFLLLLHVFFGLCLYIIARKLDAPGAWLAWAPFANAAVMVRAARRPLWWCAPLLAPLFSWLPLPGMSAVSWLLWPISLVFLVLTWMRISARLSSPPWVGVFMLVPVANMLLPAFLAFKPERFAPMFLLKRTLLSTLLVYSCLVSVIWMLVTWGMRGALKELETNVVKSFPTASAPLQQSKPLPPSPTASGQAPTKQPPPAQREQASPGVVVEPAPPSSEKISMPPDLASLTEAQYEALFKAEPPSFGAEADGRAKSVSGPASFLLSTYWPDEKSPHFWLKIRLPAMPSLQHYNSASLIIDRVANQAGQDVYDKENPFENAHFRELNLARYDGPPAYLEGLRDAHLKPGVKEEDIKKVEGVVVLQLPIGVKAVPINKAELNTPVPVGDLRFTLRKINGKQVELEVSGPIERHVATLGVDASGKIVERAQYSAWTESATKKNYTYGFKTEIVGLKALVADTLTEKRIAFSLSR